MQKLIDNLDLVSNRQVIVRANFDVPIENGQVQDTTRIEDSLSTIKALVEVNAKVILVAHYDRPEGQFIPEKSLKPVKVELEKFLGMPVGFVEYQEDFNNLTLPEDGPQVVLVENLRFWSGEESNDPDFVRGLVSLGEFYVNQAFANCHREHASIVGIPKHLPAFAGIDLAKEIDLLQKIRTNPDKPLVILIGGAKLETKEPLVKVFADVADHILVGGKIALDIRAKNVDMPENVIVAEMIPDGKDITEASAHQFAEYIRSAKSVMWNGTMGVFEEEQYQKGTRIIAKAIEETEAFTLVGGGDTETALTVLDMESSINFISTGGGAMLTYLSEGTLPGIEALKNNED